MHVYMLYSAEDYHVIPVQSIVDKCIMMEVQSKQQYVFVSLFPNCSEIE